ncbi:hypothetical protein [Saccharococcus thermophilus]|uniref:Uncharacterized protein n=1 Tax=Saccharococcus thermophilus TaxID=29396 RepID=A0A846MJF8_9BACL|nr:hypothetical protein [Saccharococcus thermophilus]NIK15744.1 hypothetical protein [Saccharococcus thermophilus]
MNTVTENKYLVLADIKATVSIEVKAKNQQEAEMIVQRQLNDLSVANVEMKLEHLNGEVLKPSIEDFEIEINSIEEE